MHNKYLYFLRRMNFKVNINPLIEKPIINLRRKYIECAEKDLYTCVKHVLPLYLLYSKITKRLLNLLNISTPSYKKYYKVYVELYKCFLKNEGEFMLVIKTFYKNNFRNIFDSCSRYARTTNNLFNFNLESQNQMVIDFINTIKDNENIIIGGSIALSFHGKVYREDSLIRDIDIIHNYKNKQDFLDMLGNFTVYEISENSLLLLPLNFYVGNVQRGTNNVITSCSIYDSMNIEVGGLRDEKIFGYKGLKVDYYQRDEIFTEYPIKNTLRIEKLENIFKAKFMLMRYKDMVDYFNFEHYERL